ncbi:MAG: diacylglycerol/lipid kinase family protein [Gemmatimonadaceae bacterium]
MIPAFVNDKAGTAEKARDALEKTGGFEVHDVPPEEIADAIRGELKSQPKRIVIAGGDGTIGMAASVVCGTDVELAVLPGGTLNHFAGDHDIPTHLEKAAEVALHGVCEQADVAYVGERLFLNTSSVGAYVSYVRLRERLERFFGYRIASFFAAIRLFFSFKTVSVELEVNGEVKRYSTPLIFIGVGEREAKSPEFGSRVPGGKHALHVLVVRERSAARLVVLAIDAVSSGLRKVARTPELDSFLVDSCSINLGGRTKHLAVDGEIVSMATPFQFRIARDALKIVVPKNPAASGSG